MATDQSPPRLRIIVTIAIGTVVTLVALKFVFESYYTIVIEDVAASKLVKPDELTALRASEAAKLNNGPAIPIDQAMQQLAAQGRMGSTLITPQPSDDIGPLTGWAHLHDGEQPANGSGTAPAMTAAPAVTDAGTMTMTTNAGDAGAAKAGADAGAPKPHAPTTATSDAGAPH
jgi:hypothetical protein